MIRGRGSRGRGFRGRGSRTFHSTYHAQGFGPDKSIDGAVSGEDESNKEGFDRKGSKGKNIVKIILNHEFAYKI